jgi:hypothetical protein
MEPNLNFVFESWPDPLVWVEAFLKWFAKLIPPVLHFGKDFLDILVVISFPASVVFVIMIVYCVEQLKKIRQKESEIYDLKIEQAYEDANTGGDPALAHRWSTVMEHISSQNQNDWKQAIIEADIMLGDLLTGMGYRGESIGEQLKRVDSAHFQTIDKAWEAHKVRNAVAHEGSALNLNHIEAKRVIDLYKKVFEEFYYI